MIIKTSISFVKHQGDGKDRDLSLTGAGTCTPKKRRISLMKSTFMAAKNLQIFHIKIFFLLQKRWHSGGRLISLFL